MHHESWWHPASVLVVPGECFRQSSLLQLLAFEDPSAISVMLQLHHPLAPVVESRIIRRNALNRLWDNYNSHAFTQCIHPNITTGSPASSQVLNPTASARVGKVCTSNSDKLSTQLGKVCIEDVLGKMESKVRWDLACSQKISVHSFHYGITMRRGHLSSEMTWNIQRRRGGGSTFTACLDIDLGDDHSCVLFRNTWRRVYLHRFVTRKQEKKRDGTACLLSLRSWGYRGLERPLKLDVSKDSASTWFSWQCYWSWQRKRWGEETNPRG